MNGAPFLSFPFGHEHFNFALHLQTRPTAFPSCHLGGAKLHGEGHDHRQTDRQPGEWFGSESTTCILFTEKLDCPLSPSDLSQLMRVLCTDKRGLSLGRCLGSVVSQAEFLECSLLTLVLTANGYSHIFCPTMLFFLKFLFTATVSQVTLATPTCPNPDLETDRPGTNRPGSMLPVQSEKMTSKSAEMF